MSIVRVGLSQDQGFADGYDAIFGKKAATEEPAKADAEGTSQACGTPSCCSQPKDTASTETSDQKGC